MDTKQQEFLTEENYNRSKKKIKTLALIVLVVGILLGGGLIVTGIVLTQNLKRANETALQEEIEKHNASVRSDDAIQAEIDALQAEIDDLNTKMVSLRSEQTADFMQQGFSEKYYQLGVEIDKYETEIANLRMKMTPLKSELALNQMGVNEFDVELARHKNSIEEHKYIPLYMLGGFFVIAGAMLALSLYLMSKRREIMAFSVQQVMPVAQEGLTKMAPTVGKAAGQMTEEMVKAVPSAGKAAGKMAEEIARGIKKGLNDDETGADETVKAAEKEKN